LGLFAIEFGDARDCKALLDASPELCETLRTDRILFLRLSTGLPRGSLLADNDRPIGEVKIEGDCELSAEDLARCNWRKAKGFSRGAIEWPWPSVASALWPTSQGQFVDEPDEEIDPLVADLRKRRFDASARPVDVRAVYTLAGKAVSTAGNLTVICADPKAGKSAVIGAMIAASFSNPKADCLGFACDQPSGGAVVHFDTEQCPADHWWLVHRALKRAGAKDAPPWLYSYSLAGLCAADARKRVKAAIDLARNGCGSIHSILIDGVADLVADVNSAEECNAFVASLHDLAIRNACPIVCVIHYNPGSAKTRGHLGSQLERKAETNLRLDKDDEATVIWADKNRGQPISKEDGPRFAWCPKAGMHVSVESKRAEQEAEKASELNDLAQRAFDGHPKLLHGELTEALAEAGGFAEKTARRRIEAMLKAGIIQRDGKNYTLAKA
jgi:hypothetical protein